MLQSLTTEQLKPNLFDYATSELSQDAFICWLAAWADPRWKESDPALHQAGREFIASMIHKVRSDYDAGSIKSINIKRQYLVEDAKRKGRIDILLDLTYTVLDESDKKAVIIIEDKIDAGLTGDQLDFYIETVSKKEEFTYHDKYYILIKSGFYDTKIEHQFFKFINRSEFINLLNTYNGKNQIIIDYLKYLQGIDYNLTKFRNESLTKNATDLEKRYFWIGIHKYLLDADKPLLALSNNAGYGYVNNASGGFNGFWWNFESYPEYGYWSYMQLEDNRLCYKIGYPDYIAKDSVVEQKARNIKDNWSKVLIEFAAYNSFDQLNTKYTRLGKTMTVAKVDNIICTNTIGILELDKTIIRLVKAQEVLQLARQKINLTNNG